MGWTKQSGQSHAASSSYVSDFVAVFDEFDAWEFFQMCTERTAGDRAYCKEVAKLVLELHAGRRLTYGERARLHVVLPDYKRVAVAISRERRSAVVFLHIAVHAVRSVPKGGPRPRDVRVLALFYERCSGGFRLRTVEWITPETRAMMDIHPSAFFKDVSA
jgi:hypothetical protein